MTEFDPAAPIADDIAFTPEEELSAYRRMLLIRRFEEKVGQLYALGAVHGNAPLSIGQEASIVGMSMASAPGDSVIAGHRSHGHMLAQGIEPERIMAELLGRVTGVSGGLGGSDHMFAPEKGFFGGHATPGFAATLGTGLAFASAYRNDRSVCLSFFGGAAVDKGRVHEAFKIAADWRLPIVFVVDNNWASPGAGIVIGAAPFALAERGVSFAIPGEQVDGIDVRKVRAAGRRAMARARERHGPVILEMLTFQFRGHGAPAERGAAKARRREETDPLLKSRARILEERVAKDSELKAIERTVREAVAAAAQAAKAAARPRVDDLRAALQI